MKRVKLFQFLRKHATGVATTELHIVHVERGMSWDEAVEKNMLLIEQREGFWLSHQVILDLISIMVKTDFSELKILRLLAKMFRNLST